LLVFRRRLLGRTAFGVAQRSPEFARAIFGRDIAAPAEISYSREYVDRERALAGRLRETFLTTAHMPADAGESSEKLRLAYEHHLPLKRGHWRVGLLRAVDGVRHDQVQRAAHAGGASPNDMAEKIAQQRAAVAPTAGR
jgi:hypothetical protein